VVRGLLAPRWLLVHLLALVAMLACFRLGWWQWDRSQESSGTLQNLGYALQWPLFGLFVPFMYWRMWKLDKERRAAEAAAVPADPVADEPAADGAAVVEAKPRRSPTEWRQAVPAEGVDEAMAQYNSYLAALSARDGE
jgi:DNA-binding transcriptional regulator of glucitol operon